jgi:hypothetical protein
LVKKIASLREASIEKQDSSPTGKKSLTFKFASLFSSFPSMASMASLTTVETSDSSEESDEEGEEVSFSKLSISYRRMNTILIILSICLSIYIEH